MCNICIYNMIYANSRHRIRNRKPKGLVLMFMVGHIEHSFKNIYKYLDITCLAAFPFAFKMPMNQSTKNNATDTIYGSMAIR